MKAKYILNQDNGQETIYDTYSAAKDALRQVILTNGNFTAQVLKMHKDGHGILKCYKNYEGIFYAK